LKNNEKELWNLNGYYYRFTVRMNQRITDKLDPMLTNLENNKYKKRESAEHNMIM
jgi:hypothetical protein